MERLILVRHGHAASNVADVVNGIPPGGGLSDVGVEQALALRELLAGEKIELGVATELRRTQETLAILLAGLSVTTTVSPGLNEIRFGVFEAGPLAAYREWAWATEPDVDCPGGGESRAAVAIRVADALEDLLARPETTVFAVSHALPIRYVVDAADGRFPAARIEPVQHAFPHVLEPDAVEAAVEALRVWAHQPRFLDRP